MRNKERLLISASGRRLTTPSGKFGSNRFREKQADTWRIPLSNAEKRAFHESYDRGLILLQKGLLKEARTAFAMSASFGNPKARDSLAWLVQAFPTLPAMSDEEEERIDLRLCYETNARSQPMGMDLTEQFDELFYEGLRTKWRNE